MYLMLSLLIMYIAYIIIYKTLFVWLDSHKPTNQQKYK